MRKLLAALSLALLAPASAFAWGAVAMSGHGEYFNSASNRGSADEAAAAAMKLCLQKMPCRIVGKPQVGKYVAIFVGDASIGEGVDDNPETAVIKARKDCERVSRSCKAKHLAWFGKPLYAGLATGGTNHYMAVNQPTSEAAQKNALSFCKQAKEASCKLSNLEAPHENLFYVQASTGETGEFHLHMSGEERLANERAISGCESRYKKPCVISGMRVNSGSSSQTAENMAFFQQFWTAVRAQGR